MTKRNYVIIADYSEPSPLTLDELCDIFNVSSTVIQELITYEIIHPAGEIPHQWEFDMIQLKRVKTALRLQRDLEVNMAGIALVLDLLDEIEALRKKAQRLEKHF